MEKQYLLKGLDCPHCSAEIENEVGKIKGVKSSSVNLITQKLTVELEDDFEGDLLELVTKIVKKHEPDVPVEEITKKEHHDEHDHEHGESCSCGCDHEHDNHNHDHEDHVHHDEHATVFFLEGLDCPHCSAEIEHEVAALPGVESASVNLISQKLVVEAENYEGNLFADVEKIVHKHEPDVPVTLFEKEKQHVHEDHDHDHGHSHGDDDDVKKRIIKLAVGAVIYALAIILSEFTSLNIYVTLAIFIVAYVILGGDVVLRALKNITRGRVFDENFLMALSTVGAFGIGDYKEGVAVMLFYQIGELFQDVAVGKSRKSISELMDIRPDTANLKVGDDIKVVNPAEVEIGDVIVVKPGEKVPLDGEIIEGKTTLDTRALTGESVPRSANVGDSVLSGCINESGLILIKVTKEFGDSTASKIIDLVENATSKKAPAENFISKFAHYYTPVVVISALLLALVPPIFFHGVWADWIYRAFVFLVISCPCALVISVPLTFFGGLGAASRRGVLIKGSNYLEALNDLENIVFDKTGTLTKGVFKVTEVNPANGCDNEKLLKIAASAEHFSNHPIARSVVNAYEENGGNKVPEDALENYEEISGHGVSVVCDGHKILAGNAKLMKKENIEFEESNAIGTKIYVAFDGKFAGSIVIADEVKEDSAKAIKNLKAAGVKNAVMLTGDGKEIAEAISKKLGLDKFFAELLPGDKVQKLEALMQDEKGKTAFVGDGINDAPVLARADIGIAMGALGSDAAIEAADIVLMTDEPSKLLDAVDVAKITKKIVTQNITFALAVKFILLVLGAFGIANMWMAIFGDVGVMIIAVINSMRMLKK